MRPAAAWRLNMRAINTRHRAIDALKRPVSSASSFKVVSFPFAGKDGRLFLKNLGFRGLWGRIMAFAVALIYSKTLIDIGKN
jgi:hypothetical protein